ncbi:MAG: hypothetical protein M0036_13985 [Desulfobacteraceae bacterium]|nr:hypothetical protein [Desulfobacteraceae bacterium]
MKGNHQTWRYLLLLAAITSLLFMGMGCDGGSGSSSSSSTSSSSGGCNSSSSSSSSSTSSTSSSGGTYDTFNKGAYATTQNLSSGPSSKSGLFYPNNIPSGTKLPIFLWGCGGGSDPSAYVDHLNHIASWGFVVIAEVSSGNGSELLSALDWLTTQNNTRTSVLYQKLDLTKVAAGGHSMGSIGTFQIASDSRLKTTIHVAGGSFSGQGPKNLRNPTAYICGADDQMGATPNAETDYQNTTVPVFMTVMTGVDHMMAARQGLPAITAWLLWHLKGETQRKADFLNNGTVFRTGIFVSKSKNW